MSEKSNEELIEDAKNARTQNKREVLAHAIAMLDERVAESTATHDQKIGRMMGQREKMVGMMDTGVSAHELDMIVSEFNH